jgi:hypothetical protein
MVSIIDGGFGSDPKVNSLTTSKSVTVSDGEATDTLHYGSNQDRANAGGQAVALGIDSRAPTDSSTAVGFEAGKSNTARSVTAVGRGAATFNSSRSLTSVGVEAARVNAGIGVTAIGREAARNNSGDDITAIGLAAGQGASGDGCIYIGKFAGAANSRDNVVIISDRNGNTRAEIDLTNGDLKIEGSLTQNASL